MPQFRRFVAWRQSRLRIAVSAPGLVLLVYAGLSLAVAETLTKPYRRALASSPGRLRPRLRDVTFPSTGDAIPLRGWFVPAAGSDRVVLIVHGRNSNRTGDNGQHVPNAAALAARGYNALLFDLRGHGESGGVRYTLGTAEQLDVLGAVAYLEDRGFAPERMGFWSHSMGAAPFCWQPPSRRTCAPSSRTAASPAGGSAGQGVAAGERTARLLQPADPLLRPDRVGADARVLNPVEVVAGLPPDSLFIIHGEADGLIPVDHARRIAAAAGPAVYDLWIVPNARHDRVSEIFPEQYEQRVLAFFDEKLR